MVINYKYYLKDIYLCLLFIDFTNFYILLKHQVI